MKQETSNAFTASLNSGFNSIQDDYDKGVYRDAAYIYGPSLPRTLIFGIKFGNF